jgi:hypothetical protein
LSDGGSWAPFGPGSSDDEPDEPLAPLDDGSPEEEPEAAPAAPAVSEPPPVAEPVPVAEPPPEPEPAPPAATFQPPVAQPLPTLPDPSSPALGWPAPTPPPHPPPVEPSGPQAPWPPQGYRTPARVPQNATVALVLGIVSILFCGLLGPFAIQYGLRARAEIDADPALGGRGLAVWGLALGVLSTSLLVLALVLTAAGVIAIT